MSAQTESYTRLHGRWLVTARVLWITLFIALTFMYVFGFFAVRDALSTVCEEERCTLGRQIRYTAAEEQVMDWQGGPFGYAEPLRPDQVEALKTLGLTLDQYGWLGALQMGIPALLFLLIAAGLFWRKSDNWMVLFVSVMLATTPLWAMPLAFTLAVRQPAWTWVVGVASVVATNADQIFPMIFPTGRFVPRWTRWTLLLELVGSVLLWFYLPFADHAGQIELVIVFILIYSSIGIYAMVYRYVRVASPLERQQLKWIFGGDTGFLLTQLLILLPLNGLLTSRAGSMDPARALILSAILNTLSSATTFLRPVSIVIAVLRYRLWDIDIILSRTLVYGILSAGIVVTYILLVGLLGTLFNTNVSLAAVLVTAALTIPSFQSLHTRVQRAVNRITFGERDRPQLKQVIEESQSESELPLNSRWIRAAHIVWLVCAMLVAVVLLNTIPVYYNRFIHPSLADPYHLGQFNVPFQVLVGLGALAESFIGFALAVLLFWRKPNDRMALFVSFFFFITIVSSSYDIFLTAYYGAQALPLNLFSLVTFPLWILLFCIFPDGRFVPRWTRWLFLVSIITSFSFFAVPFFILQFTFGPQFILVTYAQVYRYRHVSSDMELQQTKWVVFGWLMVMVLSLLASLIYKKPSGPLINIFPLMLAIAILRSRLWNIDLILNRTLVYGVLTAGIVALYIILVGTLSLLSQTTGNLLISLLATGLIAFLFQPLRERLQGSVNRLLYGDRDDPYAALSRLGQRLKSTIIPEAVLPTVVTTVREALKLPYTAIYMKQQDDDYKIIAESALPSLRVENGKIRVPGIERVGQCIPIIYQGETLGCLVLGPRAPNEAFSSSDLRLVDDLAPQVGVAVHAMRLTSDLQRSREQLVLTREEERRRLRRDLHDGLGPNLASQGLKLAAVKQSLDSNRAAVIPLLDQIMAQNKSTVEEVRRLVYGLRPPALDELGLVAAIRDYVMGMDGKSSLQIEITEPPDGLPPLSAAVEVASYRIVLEALTNVIRHAQAKHCNIRFTVSPNGSSNALCIEIQDDGRGISEAHRAGVGLRSMRERAEEIGGSCLIDGGTIRGTLILARLPIGEFHRRAPSLDS